MTDVVIPWVNANDPKWINKKMKWMIKHQNQEQQQVMDSEERYRDYGTLKYLLRSIDRNMSWVENIYLITDEQIPDWLDIENDRVKIIDHADYIDAENLPTFNSNAIELNINKIKDLDEQVVLFNDDHIVNQMTKESDFFIDGKPTDFRVYEALVPQESFDHIIINNNMIINRLFYSNGKRRNLGAIINRKYGKFMVRSIIASYFRGVSGYYNAHGPQPLLKSSIDKLWSVAYEEAVETSSHHIRSEEDINIWLARYLQLENENFVPTSPNRSAFYEINQINQINDDLRNRKHQLICINDTDTENYETLTLKLKSTLEQIFPDKCQFELK
ncbi:Stealth CR1 domain-containing protein [Latilactobacillus fuchuensis]|uniref:Stealth CR1 domain-containing protein n=1 Tax=Latilactobacillus fuchuensis TaxID=164393 RepID=UPI0039AEDE69